MLKRVISLILSLVMILGMMPLNLTASAEELPAEDLSVAETTAPTEEETVQTEAEPEETVPEETFAEIAGTIPEETAPVYLASSSGAGTCGATMFWSVDENGLLSIWGRGAMDDYSFTAASYAPWYEYRSYVKTVSISDTVTSIGNQAFNSCYNLTSIVIPASVTSVGERAFLGCSKLKTITFEGDVPSLTYAFYDISAIIYFPANNATWTEDIFQNYGGRIAWVSTGEDTIVARGMWGAGNSNDIRWVLRDNGTLTFTGTDSMYETNQRPAWDFFDSQIKKVVVNTGITSVCDYAFGGCANLTEVSLPASLTSIGDSAFSSCTAITSVVVPEGVKKIGEGAFANCSKLTDISLPNTLTSIGNYAFSYCTSLTEIDLPESLTKIEYGAFANCPGLKKVSIPKGVTYIDSYIVRECPNLETFELWYTVDLIDYDAFWNCPALRTIIFHGTPAQWNAVEKDSTVTSVLNSQNVYIQYVDPCVDGHTEVIDKKVAATCTVNGKTEGKHCSVCGKVLVAQEVIPAGHDLVNDICQRCGIITGTCGTNLTWTLDDEGKLTVSGEGFATWSGNAPWYDYRDSVKTVVLGDGVTGIVSNAFSRYGNLKCVQLSDTVEYIGPYVFAWCENLTDVTMGSAVTEIGEAAFRNCGSLTYITIPATVRSIGMNAFAYCEKLSGITVDEANTYYSSDENGVLFNEAKTRLLNCPGALTGTYTIPDSVTEIATCAFSACVNLTGVEIPDSVRVIESYVFDGCTGLTEIAIPASVTTLGTKTFDHCAGLQKIRFEGNAPKHFAGDKVVDLFGNTTATVYYPADDATWTEAVRQNYGGTITWKPYCVGEHTEVIDEGVDATCTTDGKTEGKHCSACGEVLVAQEVIPAGHTEVIDEGVDATCTTDGKTEGKHCSACGEVLVEQEVIPGGHTVENGICTKCEKYGTCGENLTWTLDTEGTLIISGTGAMDDYMIYSADAPWHEYQESVKTVIIEDGVTSIGEFAFNNHDNLAEVTIPDSVTEIADHAFINCDKLTTVEIPDSVTRIENAVFFDCDSLDNVVIPDSVVSIGMDAFYHCSGMTNLTVGNSVATIEDAAFGYCTSLTEIVIPDSVVSIGSGVLRGCGKLEGITVPFIGDREKTSADSSQYPLGYLFGTGSYEGGEATNQFYYDDPAADSRTNQTFYIPTSLKTVTVTGGEILLGAFSNCINLTEIVLPEELTAIGAQAFDGCSNLREIMLSEKITTIGRFAFADCVALNSIRVPSSVIAIKDYAFDGCNSLSRVYITDVAKWCSIEFESISSNPLSYANNLYVNEKEVTNLVVPEGVTEIKDYAFYNWQNVKSVELPTTITYIGDAFYDCNNICEVHISNLDSWFLIEYASFFANPLSFGATLYLNCKEVKSLVIPNTVTNIKPWALSGGCFEEIIIPDNVTRLERLSFMKLKSGVIRFLGNAPEVEKGAFYETKASAYYPAIDETWTEEKRENYGGTITWIADCTNGHVEVVDEGVDATCTTDGKTEGKHCSACGEVLVAQEVIPAKGHSVVEVPAVEPTINEEGNIAHFICEVCGKLFADAEGVTELKPEDVVLDKLPNGASINGNYYGTVEEALAAAKPGDVVKLMANAAVDTVIVHEGITLDLNGYTLEADYIFAVNGSAIVDRSEENTGLLKTDANHVMISKNNEQLPIWNGEGYVFTTVHFLKALLYHDNNKVQYAFLPQFKKVATDLMKDGFEGNMVTVEVRVSWETIQGREYRNLVFNNDQVALGISSGGAFILTFSGFSQLNLTTDVAIEAVVYSETGVSVVSEAIVVDVTGE